MAGILDQLLGSKEGGPGLLGGFANQAADVFGGPNAMMRAGIGLMAGDTPMAGAMNAFGAINQSRNQSDIEKLLIAKNVDPATARIIAQNPKLTEAVVGKMATPDIQHVTVGDQTFTFDRGQWTPGPRVPKFQTVDPTHDTGFVTPPPPVMPGQQPPPRPAPPPQAPPPPSVMGLPPGEVPMLGQGLDGSPPMGQGGPPMPPMRPPNLMPPPAPAAPTPAPPAPMGPMAQGAPPPMMGGAPQGAPPVPTQRFGPGGSFDILQRGQEKPPPGYTWNVPGKPAAGMQMIPGGGPQNEQVGKMADDFRSDKNVQRYQATLPAIASMREAIQRPGGAADLNLIIGLAKLFDPDSVVRGQEGEEVRKTAGLPDRIYSLYDKVMIGQGLDQKQRETLMKEAESRVAAYKIPHDNAVKHYTARAQKAGINPDLILYQAAAPSGKSDFNPNSDFLGLGIGGR